MVKLNIYEYDVDKLIKDENIDGIFELCINLNRNKNKQDIVVDQKPEFRNVF
jgi:hypothetical protein